MAVVDMTRGQRARVESYEGRHVSTSRRLTEAEADDLRYLWQSYAADLGIRSVHGALERRLLMAPPRDVWRPVLEELVDRHGGRACEGRIVHVVVVEGWGTRREVRRAVEYLTRASGRRGPRVERVATPRPESPKNCEGRCGHACAACLWTGFDLRATERGELRLGLALTDAELRRITGGDARRDRWARADARLEAECQQLACGSETPHAPSTQDEVLGARKRRAVNRATAALAKMTALDARVLACVFGVYHANEEAELEAVRRMTGGDREKARAARDAACESYRRARRA